MGGQAHCPLLPVRKQLLPQLVTLHRLCGLQICELYSRNTAVQAGCLQCICSVWEFLMCVRDHSLGPEWAEAKGTTTHYHAGFPSPCGALTVTVGLSCHSQLRELLIACVSSTHTQHFQSILAPPPQITSSLSKQSTTCSALCQNTQLRASKHSLDFHDPAAPLTPVLPFLIPAALKPLIFRNHISSAQCRKATPISLPRKHIVLEKGASVTQFARQTLQNFVALHHIVQLWVHSELDRR